MAYATEGEIKLSIFLGYKHEQSAQNGSRFTNGTRNVWSVQDGWQTADLINGFYTNHKKFEMLSDALWRKIPGNKS